MDRFERKPLPGLVTLFLVQAYCWLACLFPAHIAFTFLQTDRYFSAEAFLWAGASLVLSVIAVAAVVGIHTRSSWGIAAGRLFCIGCILAGLAGCMRLFGILDFPLGWSSYYGYSPSFFQNGTLLLVSIAMYVPVMLAWYTYFGGSRAVREAFPDRDDPLPPLSPLPPLGVGLLMVLCWIFLAAKATFFTCLWFDLGRENLAVFWRALLLASPGIVFPAVILWMVRKPGARLIPLLGVLAGWFFLSHATGNYGLIQFLLKDTGIETVSLYSLFTLLGMTPAPVAVLGIYCGILAWRFVSLPEEGAWIARPGGTGENLRDGLPLVSVLILYLSHVWVTFALMGATSIFKTFDRERWPGLVLAALCAVLVILGVWLVFARLRSRKPVSRSGGGLFFAGSIVCAALYAVSFLQMYMEGGSLEWFYRIVIPNGAIFAGLGILGFVLLARDGAPGRNVPAMPLAVSCFILFVVCSMGDEMVKAAVDVVMALRGGDGESSYPWGRDAVFRYQAAGFWLSWLVCPAIVICLIRKRLQSLGVLYAVCVVWLLGILADQVLAIGGSFLGRGSMYMGVQSFVEVQIVLTAILLFMFYSAASREFAAWRAARQRPEA
ncbi:membrane hypothetical protein [uncultured delta proteobacterium]|uniref:Uncharacterized protein n=1 Tax=uncultured delta proteobacterium TaxID=34034 RepID=A0A212JG82_9DELT|nr:membrane hypothetical protein [uncultured delta proteobacterium]